MKRIVFLVVILALPAAAQIEAAEPQPAERPLAWTYEPGVR